MRCNLNKMIYVAEIVNQGVESFVKIFTGVLVEWEHHTTVGLVQCPKGFHLEFLVYTNSR